MSRTAVAVLAVLSLLACNREARQEPPTKKVTVTTRNIPADEKGKKVNVVVPVLPPTFLDRCALGAEVDAGGNVIKSAESFNMGQKIYLTMWLKESPSALQTSARWTDKAGTEIADERRPMNGAKVATFVLDKKLKPGEYKVQGFWGGNPACDYVFRVEAEKKK